MARKKRSSDGGVGAGDWLNTYADMVTLLLTFFILLFSMSKLDSAKFNMLVQAFASDNESSDAIIIRGEVTGDQQQAQQGQDTPESDMSEIYEMLQQAVEEAGLQDSIAIAQSDGLIYINFMDNMLFEPNSAVLRTEFQDIMVFIGESIRSIQSEVKSINIVGHTAAVPDNPDYPVSDRLLSSDRANAILMFLEDQIGISGELLFATGYGKWKPLADNADPEGQSKNRRVEILISSENNSLSEQLDNVYEKLIE